MDKNKKYRLNRLTNAVKPIIIQTVEAVKPNSKAVKTKARESG